MDACAALRLIGTNISPALGFFDTPAVNLATATPLAGAPPTPIPAGIYDAGIVYKPGSANLHCLNGSSISPSAFLVQVGPVTRVLFIVAPQRPRACTPWDQLAVREYQASL